MQRILPTSGERGEVCSTRHTDSVQECLPHEALLALPVLAQAGWLPKLCQRQSAHIITMSRATFIFYIFFFGVSRSETLLLRLLSVGRVDLMAAVRLAAGWQESGFGVSCS